MTVPKAIGNLQTSLLTSDRESLFMELWDIYAQTIPAYERKSQEELRGMLQHANYRFLVLEESGAVAGFSIVFAPEGGDFALLEYMAVHPSWQQRGLGSRLFRDTLGLIASSAETRETDSAHVPVPLPEPRAQASGTHDSLPNPSLALRAREDPPALSPIS